MIHNDTQSFLRDIAKKYTLKVLIYLNNTPRVRRKTLVKFLNIDSGTFSKRVKPLIDRELIRQEEDHGKSYYSITPIGEELLKKINEIEEILNGGDTDENI